MICPNCGVEIPDNSSFCTACGANFSNPTAPNTYINAPVPAPTDPGKTLGIVSLILGILSLPACCCCGFFSYFIVPITSLAGIICGFMGHSKSKAAGFSNTLATVGMIVSIVMIVLFIADLILSFVLGVGLSLSELTDSNVYYYSY